VEEKAQQGMSLTGKQVSRVIARRAEERKLVKQEVQVGSRDSGSDIRSNRMPGSLFGAVVAEQALGGFPVCAKHCGLTRSFHKPEHIGKRSSRGILFDGHQFEPEAKK
jgi:hypothetical protein